jgi:hypothetical protein
MVTLLAEIVFRNYISSPLGQHRVNQSFFSIYVYTSAALGRVFMNYAALLWAENGQPWLNVPWHNGYAV